MDPPLLLLYNLSLCTIIVYDINYVTMPDAISAISMTPLLIKNFTPTNGWIIMYNATVSLL